MLMLEVEKAEGGRGKEQRQENFKMRMETKHRKLNQFLYFLLYMCVGQDSSVGIVTRYGLDGLEIKSW
jgi:hypothetical protein